MRVYTTGQVSKLCKVATSTVNKWVDSGQLDAYRIPGSRHRRVPHNSLVRFLQDHSVPLGELRDEATINILVVSPQTEIFKALQKDLTPEFEIVAATSTFDAGYFTEICHPDCIVLDSAIGASEALRICEKLSQTTKAGRVVLVALGGNGVKVQHPFVSDTFTKPVDVSLLAQRIRTLCSGNVGAF